MRSAPVVVRGSAAPATAWERYALPALWPTWSPQIRRVECSTERLVAGSTGRVHGPPGVAVRFVVDEVDERARTWSWTVHAGPVTMRLHHGVRADAEGCATTLVVEGPAPVVLAYLPLAGWALRRLVRP
ncbi:SRPBCC family protein [Angustibacter aerolatus]